MKTLKFIVFASGLSLAAFSAAVPSPTPTPAPTPPPSIVLTLMRPDGSGYLKVCTAPEIEQALRELQTRITDLTNERNNLAGQVIDLNTQLQRPQIPQSPPAPTPAPPK